MGVSHEARPARRPVRVAGVEVTTNEHFRFEVYLSGQRDRLPEDETLAAFGVVAKWYY